MPEPGAEKPFDFEAVLRENARRLNGRSWRWPFLGPFYEIMSDALIWRDEILSPDVIELAWALRPLFYYRTGLILGQPRPYVEYWELGRKLFPRWVGFHPSRCQPNRRHTVIYRVGHIGMIRCLKKLEPT